MLYNVKLLKLFFFSSSLCCVFLKILMDVGPPVPLFYAFICSVSFFQVFYVFLFSFVEFH